MQQPKKIIGILGGMGPAVSANFLVDVMTIAQKKYGAEQDTEFPRVYLFSTALEGFNETGFENPDTARADLVKDAKKVASWGADFLVMPCNTVHFFAEDVMQASGIPLLSIITATIDRVITAGHKKVGVVSSASTRSLGLYAKALEAKGVTPIIASDDEQKILDGIILSVMSGKQGAVEQAAMVSIIERMKNEGAESIILGCTELPLAIDLNQSPLPVWNTISILAEKAVDESYQ
jgi:aspartate racemase